MRKITTIFLFLTLPLSLFAQDTGAELIDSSIKFHDPDGKWASADLVLGFIDTRPGKQDRTASFAFNNKSGTACISREIDGRKIAWHLTNDNCTFEIDGDTSPSEEEIAQYNLNSERGRMMRNYYLYLWGLPMKLKDPGTIIDPEILDKSFNGEPAKVARVTYEKEVGNDTWYFYFDPTTSELIGYQFYHDEVKGDGEYVTLTDLVMVDGMKIPKSRSWYTNVDSTLLGTDNLVIGHAYHVH